jgi:hypothetical protein
MPELGRSGTAKTPPCILLHVVMREGSRYVAGGSKADALYVTESRPLHPAQRTSVDASLNFCVGPKPDIKGLATSDNYLGCRRLFICRI